LVVGFRKTNEEIQMTKECRSSNVESATNV
jgi:hypothetical protein